MQTLLQFKSPIYYTAGVYGWNADIYDINGVAIVTGYRPGVGVGVAYDIIRKYENKARNVMNDIKKDYKQKQKAIEKLLYKFIDEV
jgi:hypothetical protein